MEEQENSSICGMSNTSDKDPLNIGDTPSSSGRFAETSNVFPNIDKVGITAIPPVDSIPILVDNVPFFLSQAEDGTPVYIRQEPPTIEEMFLTSSSEGNPSFDGFSDASGSTFEGFSENSRSSSVTFEGFLENPGGCGYLTSEKLKLLESVKEEVEEFYSDVDSRVSFEEIPVHQKTSTPTDLSSKIVRKNKRKGKDTTKKKKQIVCKGTPRHSGILGTKSECSSEFQEKVDLPPRITRQTTQKESQNVDKLVSPRVTKRSRRLSSEEIKQPVVEVTLDANEDYIGEYCNAVGCTISFLESMRVKYLNINNGIVYELDQFAKRISWDRIFVAKWIQRLTGVRNKTLEPTPDDMLKINSVLKRRKALKVTLAGQKKSGDMKMKEFDQTEFVLPSTTVKEEFEEIEYHGDDLGKEQDKQNKCKKRGETSNNGDVAEIIPVDDIKEEQQQLGDENMTLNKEDRPSSGETQKSKQIKCGIPLETNLEGVADIKSEDDSGDTEVKDEFQEVLGREGVYGQQDQHTVTLSPDKVKVEDEPIEYPKEKTVCTPTETDPKIGTFGVSKSGRLRKPSVKGKQSIEIKSLFLQPDGNTTAGTQLSGVSGPVDDPLKRNRECKARQQLDLGKRTADRDGPLHKVRSSKYRKLIDIDNAVISFTFTDGHFVPKFKELDFNLGVYCERAGVTVEDINAETKMDVQLTKGMVKELHDFYVARGGPKTALAIRLLKMKGLPFSDYNEVLSTVAKIGKTTFMNMDAKKLEQPFTLGPERKNNKKSGRTSFFIPPKPFQRSTRETVEGNVEKSAGRFYPSGRRKRDESLEEPTSTTRKRKVIANTPSPVTDISCSAVSPQNVKKKQIHPVEEYEHSTNTNLDTQVSATQVSATQVSARKDSEQPPETSMTEDAGVHDVEVLKTKGKEGSVTRGDIVHLYTQWLKNKMAPGSNVFVTDLLKDVETLMMERKVRPIRIPAGTLMSSSVRLYDEYKQMLQTSKEDSRMYLEEDWLEDIQYLVSVSSSSRRNTIEGDESCTRPANTGASSDSGSDRDLVIDETADDDRSVKEASPPLESDKSSYKQPPKTLKSPNSTTSPKPSTTASPDSEFEDAGSRDRTDRYRAARNAKPKPCMESVGKRSCKRENSLFMNDFDYEFEDFINTKLESSPQKLTKNKKTCIAPKIMGKPVEAAKSIALLTTRTPERLKDVKKPFLPDKNTTSDSKPVREPIVPGEEYDVDRIIDYREVHDKNKSKYYKYLVRWLGFGPEEDSWVDEKDLNCPDKVAEYWKVLKREKQLRFVRMKSSNTIQYTPRLSQSQLGSVSVGERKVGAASGQSPKTSSIVGGNKLQSAAPVQRYKPSNVKEESKCRTASNQNSKAPSTKEVSKIRSAAVSKNYKNLNVEKESKINSSTSAECLKSPRTREESKTKTATANQYHTNRGKFKEGNKVKNSSSTAKESQDKENKINIIEAMIQHASVDNCPNYKVVDGERPLTKRELLDLYDSWRQENQNVLMAGGSNTVNIDILVTRVKDLMATRQIKQFHPESLLNACFMMTLMRMRLKSERALNRFLDSSCSEVLEASYKLHLSTQQKYDKALHGKKVSPDKKVTVANLKSDLLKVQHDISASLELKPTHSTTLEVLEGQVECLEKITEAAQDGSCNVSDLLQKELNVLKTDLDNLEIKSGKGFSSAESKAKISAQDKTVKTSKNKSLVDLTDSVTGKLRGDVLNAGQNLIKCGVPGKKIDSLIELVVTKIGGRKIKAHAQGTPSISEEIEVMYE